jgi:hypothetical protein
MALLALGGYGLMIAGYLRFEALDTIPDGPMVVLRVLWGVMEWSAIAAILGYARAWDPKDSPLLRYLTTAVFPLYILHQTVIIVMAHNLQPLRIAPVLEAPLLILGTFAVCLLAYEGIRRIGWLRPLFGLRPEPREMPVRGARPAAG